MAGKRHLVECIGCANHLNRVPREYFAGPWSINVVRLFGIIAGRVSRSGTKCRNGQFVEYPLQISSRNWLR